VIRISAVVDVVAELSIKMLQRTALRAAAER
jgi:hypothetical protein